jgi:hypothetical protein
VIAVLVAALALSAQDAPGPEARAVPLDRVFPFWTDYHALPEDERSAFTLDYVIGLSGGGEARFWVETEEGFEVLVRDGDGAATPPAPEAFEAGRRLFTDAPESGASVSMRLSLAGEPRAVYTMQELEMALAQAANAMRGMMGVRALLMPRLDTVRFDFDGPAPDAVLVFEDGRETPVETVYGEVITIRPRDRALRDAREVRFGSAPAQAVLETGR